MSVGAGGWRACGRDVSAASGLMRCPAGRQPRRLPIYLDQSRSGAVTLPDGGPSGDPGTIAGAEEVGWTSADGDRSQFLCHSLPVNCS